MSRYLYNTSDASKSLLSLPTGYSMNIAHSSLILSTTPVPSHYRVFLLTSPSPHYLISISLQ